MIVDFELYTGLTGKYVFNGWMLEEESHGYWE